MPQSYLGKKVLGTTMMIDFEAVVSRFWPKAVRRIQDWNCVESDRKGAQALQDKYLSTRRDDLQEWLRSYSVFQGLTGAQREQITGAVLVWADQGNLQRDLTTAEALAAAHADLEAACQVHAPSRANGKKRDFTSLASKVLWLCCPDRVPIFDAYARHALHFICKVEDGITLASEKRPEYEQFVHVWKQLYDKYKGTIENLDIGAYPYRVRVFDVTLWLIGQPSYRTD